MNNIIYRIHPRPALTPLRIALLAALGLVAVTSSPAFAQQYDYTTDEVLNEPRTHDRGFNVGIDGTASLTVVGNGRLHSNGAIKLGVRETGDGILRLQGNDASLTLNSVFGMDIGLRGRGALHVQDGASVKTGEVIQLGVNDGSQGTIHVTGAGSTLEAYVLKVGLKGDGLLRVDGGGVVTAGELFSGSEGNSQRATAIEVSGAGSELKSGRIGLSSLLRVDDGARFHSREGYLSGLSSRTGVSAITGNGSRWDNEGELEVRTALNVSDGAVLQTDTLVVSGRSILSGNDLPRETIRITGEGALVKANSGVLIGGPGSLTQNPLAISVGDGGRLEAGGNIHIGKENYLLLGGSMIPESPYPTWGEPTIAGELDQSLIMLRGDAGGVVFNHTGAITLENTVRTNSDLPYGYEMSAALINRSGDTTLSGDLTRFAGRVLVAGGVLQISSDINTDTSDYDGRQKPMQRMEVSGGTLVINSRAGDIEAFSDTNGVMSNRRTSQVLVRSGGTLAGTGTVGSTSVEDGGILSPGHGSIGAFTIDGDLFFNSSPFTSYDSAKAYYDVDLLADGQSDLITVTGAAYIGSRADGSAHKLDTGVRITGLDPATSYQAGQRYTILEADSGVTGGFDDVVSNSAFITGTLVQTDKAVHLDLALVTEEPEEETIEGGQPERLIVFGRVAHTTNQRATAAALDSLHQSGDALSLYNQLLMQDEESARRSFDELSGEAHASTRALLLRNDFLRSGVLAHLRTDPVEVANGSRAWITGSGDARSQRSDGNAAARRDHSEGLLMGYDFSFGEGWTVGAAGGRQSMRQQVRERGTRSEVDALHSGVYAAFRRDALWLRGGVSYADFKVETERSLGAGQAWEQHLRGHSKANAVSTFSELGIDLPLQTMTLTPYLGLAHTTLSTGSSIEGEGSAALYVLPGRDRVWTTTTGVRAAWDVGSGERTGARIEGGLAWQNQQGDRTVGSTQAFVVGSDAFTVYGAPLARNLALAEIGVVLRPTGSSRVNLFVQGQRGGGERGFAAQASWNVMF